MYIKNEITSKETYKTLFDYNMEDTKKRKRKLSNDELISIHYEFLRISKIILNMLEKHPDKVLTDTYQVKDYLMYCREAMNMLIKYQENNTDQQLELIILCAFMIAHKLHNDDVWHLNYTLLRSLFRFSRLKINYKLVFDIEYSMCSNAKYIIR